MRRFNKGDLIKGVANFIPFDHGVVIKYLSKDDKIHLFGITGESHLLEGEWIEVLTAGKKVIANEAWCKRIEHS